MCSFRCFSEFVVLPAHPSATPPLEQHREGASILLVTRLYLLKTPSDSMSDQNYQHGYYNPQAGSSNQGQTQQNGCKAPLLLWVLSKTIHVRKPRGLPNTTSKLKPNLCQFRLLLSPRTGHPHFQLALLLHSNMLKPTTPVKLRVH